MANSCCYCDQDSPFVAPSVKLLNQHIRLCHSNDPNFIISCSVSSCARTFRNYRTYQNHLLSHRTASSTSSSSSQINDVPQNYEIIEEQLDSNNSDYNSSGTSDNYAEVAEHNDVVDFTQQAAKWILKTSESRSLTRSATIGIVQDVSYLIDDIVSHVKQQLTVILQNHSIDTAVIEPAFDHNYTRPFNGLQTFHQQLQYYKKSFGLIVCSYTKLIVHHIIGT